MSEKEKGERGHVYQHSERQLTSLYSRQYTGDLRYPCRNILHRNHGSAIFFPKKTRPTLGSMLAKAYRTHRTTRSSNPEAWRTKAGWSSGRTR